MLSKHQLYNTLPASLQPLARRAYSAVSDRPTIDDAPIQPVADYRQFYREFDSEAAPQLKSALAKYQRLTGSENAAGISWEMARHVYAATRLLEPATVIETGVCNGASTVIVLAALAANDTGQLYSVDYPFRADESLAEFRAETFDGYGGAAIPADKDPGWIVPERLKSRWELRIGKSQRKLPALITEVGSCDLFIHDSEHSHPCLMFELELAYEWLRPGGLILADDISWNNAFSAFTAERGGQHGRLAPNTGYVVKPDSERRCG